jgi:hypothetical protein
VRAKITISERRICRLLGLPRSVLHYQSRRTEDGVQARLIELAGERRRFGYRRLHVLLEREGIVVSTNAGIASIAPLALRCASAVSANVRPSSGGH